MRVCVSVDSQLITPNVPCEQLFLVVVMVPIAAVVMGFSGPMNPSAHLGM